jgi:hypothetical protein
MSSAPYLLFIDADMVLEDRVVEECYALAVGKEVRGVIIPETTVGQGFWARCRALERNCYLGDDLIEGARFFSRNKFEDAGGYDERLVAGEDWDITTRISQGAKLPRTSSQIVHDEGVVRLADRLMKKRYYGASYSVYLRKQGLLALRQTNTLFRAAYFRNWRNLARHPVLTAGLVSLKMLEALAAISGVLFTGRRIEPRDKRTEASTPGGSL